MPKNGPFPSRESDRNLYYQNSATHLLDVETAKRLGVSEANQALLKTRFDNWNRLYPASQNPSLATKVVIEDKNKADSALMEILRLIYGDIPKSTLTSEDRGILNIAAPVVSRTSVPDPDSKPVGMVDTSKRLEHTIYFVDENASGSRAKPEGVRGCQIWYKIGSPANDPSELSYVATDTASPYLLHFAGSDAGKHVYYWLRWENTRGQVGPWSDVVMATVPG